MRLSQLISRIEVVRHDADPEIEIGGLCYDSRSVARDDLFFAVPGFKADGHMFIGDASRAGAAAIITQHWQEGLELPQIQVPAVRRAMAAIASIFYRDPSSRLTTIGVTGTNGKTTTTFMIDSILDAAGVKAVLLGGIVYRLPERSEDATRTTPEAIDLQRLLDAATGEGAAAATMEISSHAIELSRTDCLNFDVGVFTNLTREHLDLHGDMEAYYKTKRKLFRGGKEGGCGVLDSRMVEPKPVINIDDGYGRRLEKELDRPAVTFGFGSRAMVRAAEVDYFDRGTRWNLITPSGSSVIELRQPGEFNLYNALAAASTAIALELPQDAVAEGLHTFAGAPGRFEEIDTGAGFRVILDYAHNEDGLEKVLRAIRETSAGRLITVFGCPGERDRDKRPVMGHIAGELSDLSVLTTDDCYGESPARIMAAVREGLEESGGEHRMFEDRRKAIRYALHAAENGDTVLVAGKGHEKVQILPDGAHAFSDREVIGELIAQLQKD